MTNQDVYITANPTPNPNCLKFIVDRTMVEGDPVSYRTIEDAKDSPLAEKLFAIPGVLEIFAFQNFVTITKASDQVWQEFAREIGKTIREHIKTGSITHFRPRPKQGNGQDGAAIEIIERVLDEIRPSVAMDGGNIVLAGYHDGVVQVYMQGSCSGCPSSTLTLKAGIEQRLKQEIPELKEVVAIS
jgi:Fe-S cluster biogenesis protein NfuA